MHYPGPWVLMTFGLGTSGSYAVMDLYYMQSRLLATHPANGLRTLQMELAVSQGVYMVGVMSTSGVAQRRILRM